MIAPALLAAALAAQAADPVVLRVDDVQLTASDARARANEMRSRGFPVTPDAVVQNLVNEVLLADAARKEKVVSPRARDIAIANERQTVLANAYVERVLSKSVPVTEEELRRLYHQGDSVRLKLLLFTTQKDAVASRDRLKVSGAWPAENAFSVTKDKYRNAETGTLTRIQLDPGLAAEVFKAPLKELVGPVEIGLGWALFSVLERDLGTEASYAARRPTLQAIARDENLKTIRGHFTEVKRKQARLTFDDPFVESIGKRVAFSDAESAHPVATLEGRAISLAEVAPGFRGLGGMGGHMAGPSVKRQIISNFVDERILANAAVAAALDKDPEVARAQRRAELRALANLAAESIRSAQRSSADAAARDRAIDSVVAERRKRAKIEVNGPALAAALAD